VQVNCFIYALRLKPQTASHKAHNVNGTFLSVLYPCTYTIHVNDRPKRDLWVPGSNILLDFGGLGVVIFVPLLRWADEESLDVVFS